MVILPCPFDARHRIDADLSPHAHLLSAKARFIAQIGHAPMNQLAQHIEKRIVRRRAARLKHPLYHFVDRAHARQELRHGIVRHLRERAAVGAG